MRILLVTDQYFPMVGGVPSATRALASGLAQRGHAVTVLAPSPGPRSAAGLDGQARVCYLGSRSWPWYPDMRVARLPVRSVRHLVSASAPDVVHIHAPLMLGVLARRQARRCGFPVVYTNHYLPSNVSTSPHGGPRLLDSAFYAWIVGFANRCSLATAPSATGLALLRDRGLAVASRVVSNGVDTRRYAPGPADQQLRQRYGVPAGWPAVLTVGRLSGEKCIEVLLGAAARLRRPARLLIAGTGPLDGRLRARAAALGLTGRVSFLGHVPDADLPGLYRLADVFAIASVAELQSLATMEAMASGLPVVAADALALAELVEHEGNGFLFERGDQAGMARYLDALLARPGLRRTMGRASLAIIRGHDRDLALAEWESVYATLAGSTRREAA